MGPVIGLAVGYVLGARTGDKGFDEVRRSFSALCDTDEYADLLAAVRRTAGQTLHTVASMIEGAPGLSAGDSADLVDRVWRIFGRAERN